MLEEPTDCAVVVGLVYAVTCLSGQPNILVGDIGCVRVVVEGLVHALKECGHL